MVESKFEETPHKNEEGGVKLGSQQMEIEEPDRHEEEPKQDGVNMPPAQKVGESQAHDAQIAQPFKPKNFDNGAKDPETYTMWLREELWYHFMYHVIVLGYNIYTWNDSWFVVFLAWAHFCVLVVYAFARSMMYPWAKWMLTGTIGINWVMLICAMVKWNSSTA